MSDQLISLKELANILSFSYEKVRQMASSGKIPCYRLGNGDFRFDLEKVLKAMGKTNNKGK